jgi:carbamoyltransferase
MAIEKILTLENLSPKDIQAVVLNGYHQPKSMTRMERLEAYRTVGTAANAFKSILKKIRLLDYAYQQIGKKVRVKSLTNIGFKENQIQFTEHHHAHAASAYFANGNFKDEILVLTNDGAGDRLCATISIGYQGKLTRIAEVHENNSIGMLYAMFTFLMGMVPLEHEYKIMGMAPYADQKGARRVADEFHEMFDISDDGLTWRFTKGTSVYGSLNYFRDFMYLKRFDHLMGGLQLFIEEFLVNWVKSAIKQTGIKSIALSGGTFMNVKANKLIMELAEVEKIFVFPSCGDESNAIGVTYDYFAKHGQVEKLETVYFGVEWSDQEIKNSFDSYRFTHTYSFEYYQNIEKIAAEKLAEGHVIARFKGREEFGARSLGNRAIMGNPSSPEVIKTINELIKNRDFWMPFASSILDVNINRYVKMNNKNEPYYMIMTYDTKPEANEIIGGIHPYDFTVRPQLVTQKHNQAYWELINEFYKLTGIGGILNTSLNLHGLPLVYSPEDAFKVIDESRLKYLAIGNYLLVKNEEII